jgi:hypothetical protein
LPVREIHWFGFPIVWFCALGLIQFHAIHVFDELPVYLEIDMQIKAVGVYVKIRPWICSGSIAEFKRPKRV